MSTLHNERFSTALLKWIAPSCEIAAIIRNKAAYACDGGGQGLWLTATHDRVPALLRPIAAYLETFASKFLSQPHLAPFNQTCNRKYQKQRV